MPGVVIIFIAMVISSPLVLANDDNLRLGVIGGRSINKDAYLALFNEFQPLVPHSELLLVTEDDEGYKENIRRWMKDGITDVSYAHVGQRLCAMGRTGLLGRLNGFWELNGFESKFDSNFKRAVECDGDIYGIPVTYYYWGFFYNKTLFRELKISPPDNWSQFLKIINTLNNSDKIPILLGNKQNWPGLAWLDYINMRTHGLEFHLNFAKGLIPFNSKEVRETLTLLKYLVDQQAFIKNHRYQSWNDSLPLLYRREAGMILSGSYIVNGIPQAIKTEIGFFPFPKIKANVPRYEDVPIDVFAINKLSEKSSVSNAFLQFIAETKIQSFIADKLGYLPPAKDATIPNNRFAQIGYKHISEADGYAQYFDRDAIPELTEAIPEIIANFLENSDVELTMSAMEKARQQAIADQRSTESTIVN